MLKKFYPWFLSKGGVQIRDTQVSASLIWPVDLLKPIDFKLVKQGRMPAHLAGWQSLEAWGHRIGEYKDKKVSFEQWSQELEDYCVQDVHVTDELWRRIVAKNYSPLAIQLEHDVAKIINDQEDAGAPFDTDAAGKLYADLVQTRLDLEAECKTLFPAWYMPGKLFTPKRDNRKMHYVAGAECQHIVLTEFNPGSRDHIADRLQKTRGWKPTEFGSDGKPSVDEAILSTLPYPEAKTLTRYLLVQKRIGQLAEGKEALLKRVSSDGRIHGRVTTNGAVTGRATHSKPNMAQVPKVKKGKDKKTLKGEAGGWGWEFRSLVFAPPGWVMVGADASGLELRMLGHYMAPYDGGAYAREVVEGDVHSLTMAALESLGQPTRDTSKTWKYAWLYGAGDWKLGITLKVTQEEIDDYFKRFAKEWARAEKWQKKKGEPTDGATICAIVKGGLSRSAFLNKLPALKILVDKVKEKHRKVKHLLGLDKRILTTRSEHAALNTLLQSAGALVCKMWLKIMRQDLLAAGYVLNRDFQQILWVHDEVQILARPEIADAIGKIAVEAVRKAGEAFGLRVPLTGEFKVGRTWSETH